MTQSYLITEDNNETYMANNGVEKQVSNVKKAIQSENEELILQHIQVSRHHFVNVQRLQSVDNCIRIAGTDIIPVRVGSIKSIDLIDDIDLID